MTKITKKCEKCGKNYRTHSLVQYHKKTYCKLCFIELTGKIPPKIKKSSNFGSFPPQTPILKLNSTIKTP